MPGIVNACCLPSNARLLKLHASTLASLDRPKAVSGSLEDMVLLPGGTFLMGSESEESFPGDGEGPVRAITVSPFYVSKFAVTNRRFAEFVKITGYATEAERLGWSFVFQGGRDGELGIAAPGTPWWIRVGGANWSHPEGPKSSVVERLDHPVVHVSWHDALAFCTWAGFRLPTEAEWEYAARGGLEQAQYPWGNELLPGGRHMCNIWQGSFPDLDLAEDGYSGTAPVNSYDPNGFGLATMTGNAWEWCADNFDASWHVDAATLNPTGPPTGATRVLKGGSYLCHASYCNRYRNAARIGDVPEATTGHVGFRVVRDVC